jgi:hypothetical protein
MRAVISVIGGLALAAGLAACATPQGAYLNKDEPENRLLSSQMSGTVTRVDQPQQVIILDNGQMYRVAGPDAVYIDGRPVALTTVQPGNTVVIRSGTPVYYQNGQYVVVQPSGTTGAVAPGGTLTSSPPAAVVTSPGTTVVTAPPGAVVASPGTFRMTGRVVDVDRNEVKVRLDNGKSFEFRPPAGMIFRKGDPVTIDMAVGGAPSALPR